MFRSLGSRIYAAAAVASATALLLGALMLQSNFLARDAFRWVEHTQDVITGLDRLHSNLGEAESGLRGFFLTDDPGYLNRFDINIREAARARDAIVMMVSDNMVQHERAIRLRELATEKGDLMAAAVQRARTSGLSAAAIPAQRDRGRRLMLSLSEVVSVMRMHEQGLLAQRSEAADRKAEETRWLVILGCPLLVLLIAGIAWLTRNSVERPFSELLDVVTRFGQGERDARVATANRSAEFARLALAYNDMAERLGQAMDQQSRAEEELARANETLVERSRTLEVRQASVNLMSEMAHRLQAIQGEGELQQVLGCYLPKALPDVAGALYVHNNSRNLLTRLCSWGEPLAVPESFAPTDCWGLRRGQTHEVETPGADLVCAHAAGDWPVERLCEPLLAGGEVLGLLYVEGLRDDEERFRLATLMENIALALVNENLRRRLREQSIRDPLTKLFNRRYMEEALHLEAARAERNGTPLSIAMMDVDHFKRFNDGHGHKAGDALLQEVASLIERQFRQGDIVCRYGGEEFLVIAPGATQHQIEQRAEGLRRAIRERTIEFEGRRLGPVSMSFGIDTWVAGQRRSIEGLIGEADRALFRAKRLGRDRIELAAVELAQAAE